jgi:hypothetical protein
MSYVKDQKVLIRYTVENDIGIAQDRHATVIGIVNDTADLRKKIQGI